MAPLFQKAVLVYALGLGTMLHAETPPVNPEILALEKVRDSLAARFSIPIEPWRIYTGDTAGAEGISFDDSGWGNALPGFTWADPNSKVWFRAAAIIPKSVGGQPVEGLPVRLDFVAGDFGELYIDGRLREWFHWDAVNASGIQYTLTEKAAPDAVFHFAIRCTNGKKAGKFVRARLCFDVLPELDQLIDEVTFLDQLQRVAPPEQKTILSAALEKSLNLMTPGNATPENIDELRRQVAAARKTLRPVQAITRRYQVFYVGHSHIDMNWLWTWEETIDVCHRTWNSVLNLMDEFPGFHFVQSQPAAYVPIQERYPEEFARMKAKVAAGQWDLVGGMWNESDDNMPGGEALVRSLALGQAYFKDTFGHYAVTGWLPDSFGHNWQMPQLLQLAGMRYFYHMRCANGMDFTWWESPDGSRVLKANSVTSYDATVGLSQLTRPWENALSCQAPQALVVFGVGDHGGGTTREQILRAQNYQRDTVLPEIHFESADSFFDQLAALPEAPAFPVMNGDLQYFDEGCYTTHADIKKAVRGIEGDLYTAEVFSSLAALAGEPYPLREFNEAWKPAAFAQFHDIMAGSAIHSTYDWMHERLKPAFEFTKNQTAKALKTLTDNTDTRGGGSDAVVVWNSLSFSRSDIVRVSLSGASTYHSMKDARGNLIPAQAGEGDVLAFVARDVPAFGCKVYFPSSEACAGDGVVLKETPDLYSVETGMLSLSIGKSTGEMSGLRLKADGWDVFKPGAGANVFELLGDSGNAWHIRYTGESHLLRSDNAKVSVVESGPVFTRLRVDHAWGKSSFRQDVIVYGALPRVDVPISIDWHEAYQMAKIQFPVNAVNLKAEAEIPFGSIQRSTNGQECPAQKWVDVSRVDPVPVTNATPLDLSPLFDAGRTVSFDEKGGFLPKDGYPAEGIHPLSSRSIPFQFPKAGSPDHFGAAGQRVEIPKGVSASTLYLLCAATQGGRWSSLSFRLRDGKTASRAFGVNDWKAYNYPDNSGGMRDLMTSSFADNEPGVSFPPPAQNTSPRVLWIVPVPVPKDAVEFRFSFDRQIQVFAATMASPGDERASCGLGILNDCKYGFDVASDTVRISALRSADKPDPHPDEGREEFTCSLYPHEGGWRSARVEEQALSLNAPLIPVVAAPHAPVRRLPGVRVSNTGGRGNLIVTALKQSEDRRGFVLRFYESQGEDTRARIDFDGPVTAGEVDILERPLKRHALSVAGNSVSLDIGHNQVISLRFIPSPAPEGAKAQKQTKTPSHAD